MKIKQFKIGDIVKRSRKNRKALDWELQDYSKRMEENKTYIINSIRRMNNFSSEVIELKYYKYGLHPNHLVKVKTKIKKNI